MNPKKIKELLEDIQKGKASVDHGLEVLRDFPFQDIGEARLDHHRELRTGIPEIVFGERKTLSQISSIVRRMTEKQNLILVSRIDSQKGLGLAKEFPQGIYHEEGNIFSIGKNEPQKNRGKISVLSAGTSDRSVAEESAITAFLLGNEVDRIYDVGVAGLPRLLAEIPKLRESSVLIIIAGMEGALPSVVAGLVGKPIIAVPTSVGYGVGADGMAALMSMLNSCSPGVSVVNIDNGIGAAVSAHFINKMSL